MGAMNRWTAGGIAVVGGLLLVRPGTRANRAMHRRADALARHLRHLGGRLHGLSYRLRGRHPDPEASANLLADRVRSSLGPLEKRLDVPHVHVMAEDHVVLLHGEVGTDNDADEIEAAVTAVSGVLGVKSYLHVGLGRGNTRPSAGRVSQPPSGAHRRLIEAATDAGLDPAAAMPVVRGILATFAERLPVDERDQVATHLPADVRSMFTPPRRIRRRAPVRTVPQLVARITSTVSELPHDNALAVTMAVVRELRDLVPEETADVAAVLPAELRELWEQKQPG